MATQVQATPIDGVRKGGKTLAMVQEWVTTVDHKKIGLMYIGYALTFLFVGGVKRCDAHPAYGAEQPLRFAGDIQPAVHHARYDDGVFCRDADSLRVRQLSCSADDRCARHGFSAVERF